MRRLLATTLFLVAQACVPKQSSDSAAKSIVNSGNKWADPKAIPVCFMNRGEVGDEITNDIRTYVSEEFRSKAGVGFFGWGDCTASDQTSTIVRVYLRPNLNWSNSQDIQGPTGISYVGPTSLECPSECAGGTMRLDIGNLHGYPQHEGRDKAMRLTRGVALHEFGHVMGLIHEHQRSDAVGCGDVANRTLASDSVV